MKSAVKSQGIRENLFWKDSPLSLLSKMVASLTLAFLLVWAFLWKGSLPYYIDARMYAYPDHAVNRDAFERGFLPLWNSALACGTPHLANWQSACLYPPFWILNLTSLADGFMGITLAHAVLAFLGFYFWLRSQKIISLWSLLGAFSFAGSAHLICCWTNLPFIATAAWIPWIFWAAQRALEKPILVRWMILGTALILQVLAGYPFFTFYTVVFLLVWFESQKPAASVRRALGLTFLGAALATAAQWLPFLDFLSYGFQEAWQDYPYYTKPIEYLTLFKSDILGLLGSTGYRGSFANANFNLYFGLIPLGAFLASIFLTRRAKSRFWVLGAFVFLIWMAGRHCPIWNFIPDRWLEWVEPSKAAGLFLLCAITASTLALNTLLKGNTRRQNLWAGCLAFLWLLDLFQLPSLLLHPMPNPYQNPALQQEAIKIKSETGGKRMLSMRLDKEMASLGTSLPDVLSESFQTPMRLFWPNSNAAWGIRSMDSYLVLQVEGSQNLKRYETKAWPYSGDLLDVAGVKILLAPSPLVSAKYTRSEKWDDHYLIQNNAASADMRWVSEKREWETRPALLNQLALPGNPWREKVYLDQDQTGADNHLPPSRHPLNEKAAPGYQRQEASRASWDFQSLGTGYVVFDETYAPGWRAWVDTRPVPILRAYGLFMAAEVAGAGGHQVVFRYEPASVRLGLFLSLLGLGLGAFGLLRLVRKNQMGLA